MEEISRVCPLSDETLVGCRHYIPVSEHGDFPTAGDCRFAETVQVTEHVRQRLCWRRTRREVPTTYDQV